MLILGEVVARNQAGRIRNRSAFPQTCNDRKGCMGTAQSAGAPPKACNTLRHHHRLSTLLSSSSASISKQVRLNDWTAVLPPSESSLIGEETAPFVRNGRCDASLQSAVTRPGIWGSRVFFQESERSRAFTLPSGAPAKQLWLPCLYSFAISFVASGHS